jgi:PBP1b-binding outer membrane lipoprotein LpoB
MLKIFSAVLLVTAIYGGCANAHGGGGAESMPGTNYTDMPAFSPHPVAPPSLRSKSVRSHTHAHRGAARGN